MSELKYKSVFMALYDTISYHLDTLILWKEGGLEEILTFCEQDASLSITMFFSGSGLLFYLGW